jgi:hypothetical protein
MCAGGEIGRRPILPLGAPLSTSPDEDLDVHLPQVGRKRAPRATGTAGGRTSRRCRRSAFERAILLPTCWTSWSVGMQRGVTPNG